MTLSLITANNDELRGRIKQINDILELPTTIYYELLALQDALPD